MASKKIGQNSSFVRLNKWIVEQRSGLAVGGFMSTGQARTSLSELRGRTDRQLVVLIRSEAEKAVRLAGRSLFVEAETRFRKARTLLDVTPAPERERAELEARLKEARAAIERSRGASPPCWRSTSSCPAA